VGKLAHLVPEMEHPVALWWVDVFLPMEEEQRDVAGASSAQAETLLPGHRCFPQEGRPDLCFRTRLLPSAPASAAFTEMLLLSNCKPSNSWCLEKELN